MTFFFVDIIFYNILWDSESSSEGLLLKLITDSESSSESHLLNWFDSPFFYLLIKYSATASYAGIETGSMYLFDESGFDENLTITISAVGSM